MHSTRFSVQKTQFKIISIPVNPIYNKEALVIEGIPSTIDIELTGSKSRINKLKDINDILE